MNNNHSILLANGIALRNLGLNGNNYISSTEVKSSIFLRNCSPVIFSDGITEDRHEHMELVHILPMDGEWWIAFRDVPPSELQNQKNRADIDYIAMMTDVNI